MPRLELVNTVAIIIFSRDLISRDISNLLTKVLTRNFISFPLQDRMSLTMRLFLRLVLPFPVCTLSTHIVRGQTLTENKDIFAYEQTHNDAIALN